MHSYCIVSFKYEFRNNLLEFFSFFLQNSFLFISTVNEFLAKSFIFSILLVFYSADRYHYKAILS